jgi:plastocyanin
MKKLPIPWRFIIAALIAAAAVVPIVLASRDGGAPAEPREIRLVVRDMTFYLEGQDVPNPTLRVRAGEQIRLVLRNEDPGMDHDLTIKSWNVATATLEKKGEEAAVRFRVPDRRGVETYTCTPHAEMMQGAIHIE